jgi:hypothetical protein
MLTDRAANVAAARHAMTQMGVSWGDVRAWALTAGWKPADVPVRSINPDVVGAYQAANEETR